MGRATVGSYYRDTPLTDVAKLYLEGRALQSRNQQNEAEAALNNQLMNFREGANTGMYGDLGATEYNNRLAAFGMNPVQQWDESGGSLYQPYATEPSNRPTQVGLSAIAQNYAAANKENAHAGLYGAQATGANNMNTWLGDVYGQGGAGRALGYENNPAGMYAMEGGLTTSGNNRTGPDNGYGDIEAAFTEYDDLGNSIVNQAQANEFALYDQYVGGDQSGMPIRARVQIWKDLSSPKGQEIKQAMDAQAQQLSAQARGATGNNASPSLSNIAAQTQQPVFGPNGLQFQSGPDGKQYPVVATEEDRQELPPNQPYYLYNGQMYPNPNYREPRGYQGDTMGPAAP